MSSIETPDGTTIDISTNYPDWVVLTFRRRLQTEQEIRDSRAFFDVTVQLHPEVARALGHHLIDKGES